MTPAEVGRVVELLEFGWPNRDMAEQTAMLYMAALSDLPFDAAVGAVKRLLLTDEFRPSVAAVRREVALSLGLLPPGLDDALVEARAWCEWREQARFGNGSGSVSVCPPIHHVVVKVCRSLSVGVSDAMWASAFRAAYRAAVEVEERSVLTGVDGRELGAG